MIIRKKGEGRELVLRWNRYEDDEREVNSGLTGISRRGRADVAGSRHSAQNRHWTDPARFPRSPNLIHPFLSRIYGGQADRLANAQLERDLQKQDLGFAIYRNALCALCARGRWGGVPHAGTLWADELCTCLILKSGRRLGLDGTICIQSQSEISHSLLP